MMRVRKWLQAVALSLLAGGMPHLLAAAEPSDADQALASLSAQAEQGDAAAQFDLGNRYLKGNGVEQDNFEALRWFKLAADAGNVNAQYNIAVMYLNGIGVIQDGPEAVQWFLAAAENGDAQSQFTLGILLFNGQLGVPQNVPEAYKWFTLAGAAGHQSAAANAVLIQEMLPANEVMARQAEAQAWIEAFNARLAENTSSQP